MLSISQINKYIKSIIDSDINLQSVFVRGEISNFVNHRSGHFYLTLKDEGAEIKSVMFRSANARLKFVPENGMKVVCKGRISVYEAGGSYQLYIDTMIPDGTGELNLAFEQLKEKLSKEGLFDKSQKKEIPAYPRKVGVITSPTGAAVQDIGNVLSRRFPLAEMVFYPALVQGEGAAQSVVEAIEYFNNNRLSDVLIIGRGGGSTEDLWAFNEELLARAVFKSEIPVISAVGHETDFTICDFVADLRAPTPSAAAELAVPDINAEINHLTNLINNLTGFTLSAVENLRFKVSDYKSLLEMHSPQKYISDLRVRCDKTDIKLESISKSYLLSKRKSFSELCSRLDALSPLKVMSRGYAAVSKDSKSVISAFELEKGDIIDIDFADGKVNCIVN